MDKEGVYEKEYCTGMEDREMGSRIRGVIKGIVKWGVGDGRKG
jgi:hypothetical protein